MTPQSESRQEADLDLPCGTIIFRLLTRSDSIDQDDPDVVQPAAFTLRPGEEYLSAFIRDVCPLEVARTKLGGVKAVATLHVGRLRDMGLDVQRDPNDRMHAKIVGVLSENDAPDEAPAIEGKLANHARICWRRQITRLAI